MKELVVTKAAITSYLQFLKIQEKSKGTLEKYQRELLDLEKYLKGKKVTKEDLNCTPFVRQYDILNNKWGDFYAKRSTK